MSRPPRRVGLIRDAKAGGVAVTCDTAPPYFDLNETAIGDFRTFAKLSPPLRTEADRRGVCAGLADGTIDAIASDHQPRDADDKRLPFAQAAPGGVGLATLLGVTLAQVHNATLSLAQAIALLTVRPARLLGVDAGRLGRGAAARPVPVPAGADLAGRGRPAGRQIPEHAVRRPRAGGAGERHVENAGDGSFRDPGPARAGPAAGAISPARSRSACC